MNYHVQQNFHGNSPNSNNIPQGPPMRPHFLGGGNMPHQNFQQIQTNNTNFINNQQRFQRYQVCCNLY